MRQDVQLDDDADLDKVKETYNEDRVIYLVAHCLHMDRLQWLMEGIYGNLRDPFDDD